MWQSNPLSGIRVTVETPEHGFGIDRVVLHAFARCELGYHGEANFVAKVRDQGRATLSLVALDDERVVGHILFSRATIETPSQVLHGVGLAPLAVDPEFQGRGIGTQLVLEGLRRIEQTDAAFVLVAGHPAYYRRFEFDAASDFGITHGFANIPQEIFFVRWLDTRWATQVEEGLAYFDPIFGPQHEF